MINIDTDLLSLEFKERDFLIPIDAKSKDKGCVTVRLREIPYAVKKSLDIKLLSASDKLDKCKKVFEKISQEEQTTSQEIDSIGEAFGSLRAAQIDLVKWSVCGHNESDFLVQGKPYPFETTDSIVAGIVYKVASPKILKLYQIATPDNLETLQTSFFASLAYIARMFQVGTVITPQDIWDNHADTETTNLSKS